jgi:hypothetical protein
LSEAATALAASTTGRNATAHRVFQGALVYTGALTLFWLFFIVTRRSPGSLFSRYQITLEGLRNVAIGFLFFSILWGLIWYGVKNLLLARMVGFSPEERRVAFRSRMREPYDLPGLLARHSERRIRIADMIGRRGRFITLQLAGFFYLYNRIATEPTPQFLTLFLQDNLFDAVAFSWVALGLYYSDGFLARMFYGAQSRVMDGTLARANCLLITTLWSVFKFVMLPISVPMGALFPPPTYSTLFILIWGAYTATDAASEVVGALFGKQKLRVWGMGDVNRKSVAGAWGGFLTCLGLCLWVVLSHHLPAPWIGLAVAISICSTVFELLSPRGTDDFTMATANALVCLAFGAWVL